MSDTGSSRTEHVDVYLRTSLSRSALAVESANPVDASGTVEASGASAVIDVDGTLRAGPAVDADAREAADRVSAGCAVLAD